MDAERAKEQERAMLRANYEDGEYWNERVGQRREGYQVLRASQSFRVYYRS